MRSFYFAGWHITETKLGWTIDNVTGVFDCPEQAKAFILTFEGR